MDHDLKALEFDEFKNYLADGFSSMFAKDAARQLLPLKSIEEISSVQKEIGEALDIAERGKIIDNDEDFYLLYKKLVDKSFTPEPLDFITIKVFLEKTENLKEKLLIKPLKFLKNIINNLNPPLYLKDEIAKCLDDGGEIKDDATPELKTIRWEMGQYRSRIRRVLNDLLNSPNADKFIQDKVIVLRNGRYTVPAKTNFSQYIQGLVQDRSASGQTLYIEPLSCVSINNSMRELILRESEETFRILSRLIFLVDSSSEEITALTENYKHLAFRLETGFFYRGKPYTFGEAADAIKLEKIHHPLLYLKKGEDSVPIDFSMEEGKKTAVITGPNTGGKTAALKSLGLNHLISFCGFPVFGSAFKFRLFRSVLADIGDKQSLVMDLSTFSSHMLNIKRIMGKASEGVFVLFDELGTGTEPREGAALAVAILKILQERGALTVVTTHFPEVKNFVLNNDVSVFYAVDFDYETFAPRYALLKNVIGKSDPILIATRLGFGKEITDAAKRELSKYKSSVEVKAEELSRMLAEAEHEKRLLEIRKKELEEKEKITAASEEALRKRLDSKELSLLEETYALLQKGRRIASEKIKITPEDIEKELKETSEKIERLKSRRKALEDIKAGDVIFLEKYNKTAKVLAIENDSLSLNMEGIRVKIKKRDAVGRKIVENKQGTVKITSGTSSASSRRELLLVGKRAEEALDMLDKFIDESLLAEYDKVYIIHGRGSGRLRKAVHEFLRNSRAVKGFSAAENSEGGAAVTTVEL